MTSSKLRKIGVFISQTSSMTQILNKKETELLVFGYIRLQSASNVFPDEISDICCQYFINKFVELGIKKTLLRGIFNHGFKDPTNVQQESISNILMGNNIVCYAANGTGKTGAYCIPILQLIDISKTYIQSIILVPTRELALQTAIFIKQISKYFIGLNQICTTSATSLHNDILQFKQKNIHLVVAAPGRMLDLAVNGHAVLSKCNLIVMDEANKLLSHDFISLIERILTYIPQKTENGSCQLLVYSSVSLPSSSIKEFVGKHTQSSSNEDTDDNDDKEKGKLSDQRTVYLDFMDNALTLCGITQFYAYVGEQQKVQCLFTLIKKLEVNQCIIFCRSINRVELLARKIVKLGFSCYYIHIRMTQNDRSRVFNEFVEGKCKFLICTDLITRGIHIKDVNVVINFDFPKAAEAYLQRIGRAARFEHLAVAISFVTDDDRNSLYQIENDLDTEIKPIIDVEKINKELYCSSDIQ